MKQLSRKKIQDMIDLNGANISSRRSSGGSGAGGGGGVSSAWVDEHYVSKDFFARLFTINGTDENDDDVVVEPNDLETTITDIQLMFGTWTEHYLSALGIGSGGGGGGGALLTEPLASINEAGMGTPSGANKVIAWNGSTWTYMPYNTGNGTVTSIRIAVPMGFSVNPSTAITTSGTFTISFARGTLGNGMVLATPSSGTGDPIWRALVADDIPTLTAAKISDITLTDGTLTIGNNSITPITDATLKSNYTWWGGAIDSTGKREGNMSNVGNISFSASGKNIGSVAYFDTTNHRLGIGSSPGAYKLDVNGDIRTSGNLYIGGTNRILSGSGDSAKNLLEFDGTQVTLAYGFRASNETRIYGQNISMYHGSTLKVQVTSTGLKIGDATLSWDSTNHALKIDTGFYSESFISALGAGSGGGGSASDYIPISGSSSITGSLTPATRNTYDLGSATNAWNTLYVNSISGNASLSVQGVSCTTFSTSARAVISSGAKFASICVESDSSGSVSSSRVGEINRYNASLHLQYDSGTSNVTMCRQGFVFSTYTDGGGNNLSVIDTNNRSLRIELGSSSLNPYISKSWNEGSDIRLKNIVKTIEDFDIQEIANAPVFDFTYKNDDAKIINLGTSAQYWKKVMPSAVKEMGDGYLSMNYGGTALAAAVLTARKVVNHEDRIRELENRLNMSEAENRELRKEIEILKAA